MTIMPTKFQPLTPSRSSDIRLLIWIISDRSSGFSLLRSHRSNRLERERGSLEREGGMEEKEREREREREREEDRNLATEIFRRNRGRERKGGERVLATEAIFVVRRCEEGKNDNGGEKEERGRETAEETEEEGEEDFRRKRGRGERRRRRRRREENSRWRR